jgi:ribonuclease-3
MPDLTDLQNALGGNFRQPSLLQQALVHSSYINENPTFSPGHNERLEFLGDAVLGFIIAGELYTAFPDRNEGDLTRLRANLVRRDTLAQVARSIGLGSYLYMGKGEEASGGRDKSPNLAGALEAVIAAVYLDRGIDTAWRTVMKLLENEWRAIASINAVFDFKSKLQEITQSKFQQTPVYRMVAETGPDHDKTFTVEVGVNDRVLGSGSGKSKKLAETEAARVALETLEKGFT